MGRIRRLLADRHLHRRVGRPVRRPDPEPPARLTRFFRRSPGIRPRLRLLSRPGCHLCEERHAAVGPLVAEAGGTLEIVDVDSDPALAARFGNEIPVILDAEGRILARARDPLAKIQARLLPR